MHIAWFALVAASDGRRFQGDPYLRSMLNPSLRRSHCPFPLDFPLEKCTRRLHVRLSSYFGLIIQVSSTNAADRYSKCMVETIVGTLMASCWLVLHFSFNKRSRFDATRRIRGAYVNTCEMAADSLNHFHLRAPMSIHMYMHALTTLS